MQAAFEAGAVEQGLTGDWEDVQVELGLLPERQTEPRYQLQPGTPTARQQKAKERRRSQKRSRQRNRRK
jgi:hypothetical protein